MSDCYIHPGRDGVGACVNCGQIICAECKTVLGGKMYCQRCAEKMFVKGEPGAKKPAAAKEKAAATAPAGEQKGGKRPWLIPAIIGGGVFAVVVIVVIVVAFAVLIPASREAPGPSIAQPPAAGEQPSTPSSTSAAAPDTNDEVSPRGPTGTIATGDREELATQAISATGGFIIIDQPGNPLDGMEIVVPPDSYPDSRTFTVAYAPITGHTFGDNFNPLTPMIIIENGGEYSDTLMTVRVPVQVPDDHFAMGFFYHEDTGKLEGMMLADVEEGALTVASRHFSCFTISSIAKAVLEANIKADIDSHFRPGIDDWQFNNKCSSISHGGNCEGQSLTAMWYFCRQPDGEDMTLHGRYDNNFNDWKTPALWQDDSLAYRLCSVAQINERKWGSHRFWRDIAGKKWKIENSSLVPVDIIGINDEITRYLFAYSIQETGEPQEVVVWTADRKGHAMVVYRIYNGSLYIADPNYSGNTERRIIYANGKLEPYESGANLQEIEAGDSLRYEIINYAAKSTVIPWEQIELHWQAFRDGTIGNDKFPQYQLFYIDEEDDKQPLTDGLTINENKIYITGNFTGSGAYEISVYKNGELLRADDRDKRDNIPARALTPGANLLGICLNEIVANRAYYIDFQYITVNCGEEEPDSEFKCDFDVDYSQLTQSPEYEVGKFEDSYKDNDGNYHGLYIKYYAEQVGLSSEALKNAKRLGIKYMGCYRCGKQEGRWLEYYESGSKKTEEQYNENGKLHGTCTSWYENGNKMWEAAYQDGVLYGPYMSWHEDGSKDQSGYYTEGKRTGIWTTYNYLKGYDSKWDYDTDTRVE